MKFIRAATIGMTLSSMITAPAQLALAQTSPGANNPGVQIELPDSSLELPTKKLATHPERARIIEFLTRLNVHNNWFDVKKNPEVDPVLFYWTPQFKLDDKIPGSWFENTDVKALNNELRAESLKLLTYVRNNHDKLLGEKQDSVISEGSEYDSAVSNLSMRARIESPTASATPSAPANAATDAENLGFDEPTMLRSTRQLSDLFSALPENVWSNFRTIVELLFMRHTSSIPTSDLSRENVKFTIATANSAIQRHLTLSFKVGFTAEEMRLFNEYRAVYPNLRWKAIKDTTKPVSMKLQSVSNAQHTEPDGKPKPPQPLDQSNLGVNLFNAGELKIALGEAVIEFPLSGAGVRSLEDLFKANRPMLLPIRFTQDVGYSLPLKAKVDCSFEHFIGGDISVSAIKNLNNDVFTPIIQNPESTEMAASPCKIITDPKTDPLFDRLSPEQKSLTYRALVNKVAENVQKEFAAQVQASLSLRDQIVHQLLDQVRNEFTQAMPEQVRSRISQAMVKECRRVYEEYCSNYWKGPFGGGVCMEKRWRDNEHCSEVNKEITEFYKVHLPVNLIRASKFERHLKDHKTYEFNETYTKTIPAAMNANLCLRFTGQADTPFAVCSNEERTKGDLNYKREQVNGKPLDPNDKSGDLTTE